MCLSISKKILPCAALFHSSKQYYDSPVRLFIFRKIPSPVRLFHTMHLLDIPEYSVDFANEPTSPDSREIGNGLL